MRKQWSALVRRRIGCSVVVSSQVLLALLISRRPTPISPHLMRSHRALRPPNAQMDVRCSDPAAIPPSPHLPSRASSGSSSLADRDPRARIPAGLRMHGLCAWTKSPVPIPNTAAYRRARVRRGAATPHRCGACMVSASTSPERPHHRPSAVLRAPLPRITLPATAAASLGLQLILVRAPLRTPGLPLASRHTPGLV
ncbi:hypothetical protein FA95DRAFT_532362 [Auriscalpium vulgare]|uniref:Uncharacterized protein n=1 Tax=Auriscalpium vulgare TaxID=40419 RepID=A0ACB8RFU2_9AGAM|nr:hypothetical protein FA95DRAFT_532362 [Auriscalpium vulgare]